MPHRTQVCAQRSRRRSFGTVAVLCWPWVVLAQLIVPLDPYAIERDPNHDHIVVGGSSAERSRALASHLQHERRHRLGRAQALDEALGATGGSSPERVRVLSVRNAKLAGAFVLGIADPALLSAGRVYLPVGPVRYLLQPTRLSVFEVTLPVPEPPPRAA